MNDNNRKSIGQRLKGGCQGALIGFAIGETLGIILVFIGAALGFLEMPGGIADRALFAVIGAWTQSLPGAAIGFLIGFVPTANTPAKNLPPPSN